MFAPFMDIVPTCSSRCSLGHPGGRRHASRTSGRSMGSTGSSDGDGSPSMPWVRTQEWAQSKRDLSPAQARRGRSSVGARVTRRSVMSAIRVPSGTASPSSPIGFIPGARESKLSRYFLLWLPVAPFVGFTLAETVFDLGAEGDWEPWNAALLRALLMAPFAVGAYLGLRSILKGFRG